MLKKGDRFGALVLDSYLGNDMWNAICDCGNNKVVSTPKGRKELYPCCGRCRRLGTWAAKEVELRKQKELQTTHVQTVNKNKGHYYSKTSRGYVKSSKNETVIYKQLTRMGMIFETEKEFGACYPQSNVPFRFDFCVASSTSPVGFYLIEYDGQQHQKPIEIFGGNEQFKKQQWQDWYKNQWCKNNNIPLIRVSGNAISNEDLKLETTKFRVV